MFFVWLIGLLALIDLGVKNEIEDTKDSVFPKKMGWITLKKNHNPGFSFGFLKEKAEFVLLIPVAVASGLLGIFLWVLGKKGNVVEKLILAVTLGGAISNLYDRVVRSYVVDYLTVEWKWLKDVVFNLGDVCIVFGMGMMIVYGVMKEFFGVARKRR